MVNLCPKKIQFKDKWFEITVLTNTMHPGFAISTFTQEEVEFREKYWNIKEGDVVVDVGAAYGSYTLPALAMGAKVIAFEPEVKIIDNLRANVSLNNFDKRCDVISAGLGDQNRVYVDIKSYAPHYATQLTSPQYFLTTLDSWKFDKLDWLKIDVEGYEENVVAGGMQTIKEFKPNLIIECDDFIDQKIKDRIMDKLPWYNFEVVPRGQVSLLVGVKK